MLVIGSLRGSVIDKKPLHDRGIGNLLLEVNGVGYNVTVTLDALSSVSTSEEIFFHIYHHIREADQKLFGFLLSEERQAFEGLLSAHGVGPSLALAVLSTHPVAQLASILDSEDIGALCEVPGVGKKTAQRLLVELKSTLVLPVLDTASDAPVDLKDTSTQNTFADVREALVSFGYSAEEIRKALGSLPPEAQKTQDSGQLLKQALRSLGGK